MRSHLNFVFSLALLFNAFQSNSSIGAPPNGSGSGCVFEPVWLGSNVSDFKGSCVDGKAHGQGAYTAYFRTPEGKPHSIDVSGRFVRGRLHGGCAFLYSTNSALLIGECRNNRLHGWVRSAELDILTEGQYRGGRPFEIVVWNDKLDWVARESNGIRVAKCTKTGVGAFACPKWLQDDLLRVARRPLEIPTSISINSKSESEVDTTADFQNPDNLPVFVPPIITERIRKPNGDWGTISRYQIECPAKHYCPPVEVAYPEANRPVIGAMPTTGLAGVVASVCKDVDCGREIFDRIVRRSLSRR